VSTAQLCRGGASVCAAVSRRARRSLARLGSAPDKKTATRRWVGAAPTGTGTRGEVAGDVSSVEVLGRLGETSSTRRPLGVRRSVGSQSAVDSVQ
jgi:hypothetical protein